MLRGLLMVVTVATISLTLVLGCTPPKGEGPAQAPASTTGG